MTSSNCTFGSRSMLSMLLIFETIQGSKVAAEAMDRCVETFEQRRKRTYKAVAMVLDIALLFSCEFVEHEVEISGF